MLKKLVKYGNSTALVIDKAILELLNMNESTAVKLGTDGKSLIITPVQLNEHDGKISYDSYEALDQALSVFKGKLIEKEVVKKTEMAKNIEAAMQQEFKEAFAKNGQVYSRFAAEVMLTQEYKDASAELAQQFDPITQNEAYLKELKALNVKFYPELGEMQKSIDAIYKKYNSMIS